MNNQTIGFIGGGNMARSLVSGLLNTSWPKEQISVCEPDQDKRNYFEHHLGLRVSENNETALESADVVVLAVKPQVLREALLPLTALFQKHRPLVVSIVAGIREKDIQRWLGGNIPIVRAMPNTPAMVGSGAAGLYANSLVQDKQRNIAESLLRSVGVAVWLDQEQLLDPVTALSGSGPAYFMYFMENLQQAAVDRGLDPDTARLLTVETCLGAAKLAIESQESLPELRRRVTSPGGTTESALSVMEQAKVADILKRAFDAAAERAVELGQILGES